MNKGVVPQHVVTSRSQAHQWQLVMLGKQARWNVLMKVLHKSWIGNRPCLILLSCDPLQHYKMNKFHWMCEGYSKNDQGVCPHHLTKPCRPHWWKQKKIMEKFIIKVHSKHAKYGCIIWLNGWIDVSKCPLINVMSISPFLVLFLKNSLIVMVKLRQSIPC